MATGDQELLARAKGLDVLPPPPNYAKSLTNLILGGSGSASYYSFNAAGGCSVASYEKTAFDKHQGSICAFCSVHKGPDIHCVRLPSSCNICHVPLCTIPLTREDVLSWFEYWHRTDHLVEQVYYSGPAHDWRDQTHENDTANSPRPESKKRRYRSGPSDAEQEKPSDYEFRARCRKRRKPPLHISSSSDDDEDEDEKNAGHEPILMHNTQLPLMWPVFAKSEKEKTRKSKKRECSRICWELCAQLGKKRTFVMQNDSKHPYCAT